MTSADAFSLTRLFIAPNTVAAPATLSQPWIGGTMTSWDATSYANTVVVGPITYQNLPIVSPNGLTTGTVLLAKISSGYAVIGMLGSAKTTALLDPIRYRRLRSDVSLPNTTFLDVGILNFLLRENTEYGLDGVLFGNSTTSNDFKFAWSGPPNMAAKWSMFGLSNATTNGILTDVVTGYSDANPQTVQGAGFMAGMRPGGWFATTDTPGLLQLRAALASGTTAGTLAQGSWLRLSELGTSDATDTFIKTYVATGSRSYNGSGNPISTPDGDNNMYTWSVGSRSNGSERHMWTFPAATIRADLTGATVLSAQMYLYCFASDQIPSDYNWEWSTTSSIAATWPTNGFAGQREQNLWQLNSWAGFDITTELTNVLNNNANSVLGGSFNINDTAAGFRGYGFSAAYRPYIQITYAV